jgi:hypothetical protein
MKPVLILLAFIASAIPTHAQYPWDPHPQGEGIVGFNTYSHTWKIIKTRGTLNGTVLKFTRQMRGCGDVVSSSVAILKRPHDTIRVIMTCNGAVLLPGQQVTIKVSKWHSGFGPGLPVDDEYFMEQKKKGMYVYRVNEFDETVSKTVFGRPVYN